jgi:hypothetical protein
MKPTSRRRIVTIVQNLKAPPPERHPPKAPLQRPPAAAINEELAAAWSISIYEARAVTGDLAACFTAAIKVSAARPEECGFCPVINKPSWTT